MGNTESLVVEDIPGREPPYEYETSEIEYSNRYGNLRSTEELKWDRKEWRTFTEFTWRYAFRYHKISYLRENKTVAKLIKLQAQSLSLYARIIPHRLLVSDKPTVIYEIEIEYPTGLSLAENSRNRVFTLKDLTSGNTLKNLANSTESILSIHASVTYTADSEEAAQLIASKHEAKGMTARIFPLMTYLDGPKKVYKVEIKK